MDRSPSGCRTGNAATLSNTSLSPHLGAPFLNVGEVNSRVDLWTPEEKGKLQAEWVGRWFPWPLGSRKGPYPPLGSPLAKKALPAGVTAYFP